MGTLICIIIALAFALAVFWDVLSVALLPIAVCFVAYLFAFIFGHFKPTNNKARNVTIAVLASVFFVVSVYFSLNFPSEMADGQYFRNVLPFLNVSFR